MPPRNRSRKNRSLMSASRRARRARDIAQRRQQQQLEGRVKSGMNFQAMTAPVQPHIAPPPPPQPPGEQPSTPETDPDYCGSDSRWSSSANNGAGACVSNWPDYDEPTPGIPSEFELGPNWPDYNEPILPGEDTGGPTQDPNIPHQDIIGPGGTQPPPPVPVVPLPGEISPYGGTNPNWVQGTPERVMKNFQPSDFYSVPNRHGVQQDKQYPEEWEGTVVGPNKPKQGLDPFNKKRK